MLILIIFNLLLISKVKQHLEKAQHLTYLKASGCHMKSTQLAVFVSAGYVFVYIITNIPWTVVSMYMWPQDGCTYRLPDGINKTWLITACSYLMYCQYSVCCLFCLMTARFRKELVLFWRKCQSLPLRLYRFVRIQPVDSLDGSHSFVTVIAENGHFELRQLHQTHSSANLL